MKEQVRNTMKPQYAQTQVLVSQSYQLSKLSMLIVPADLKEYYVDHILCHTSDQCAIAIALLLVFACTFSIPMLLFHHNRVL